MELIPKIKHKAAKLVPSSLLAILVACFIEFVIVRRFQCVDRADHGSDYKYHGNATHPMTTCETQVIGEVTPFTFTYPQPFFLHGDYLTNGIYNVGPSQA